MNNNQLIESLLKSAPISTVIGSYIKVIKAGKGYKALCPFHADNNPSLMINDEKGIFKCFVCGEGGSAITFIQKYEKISFQEAVLKLAALVGFKDPGLSSYQTQQFSQTKYKYLYEALTEASKYYNYVLLNSSSREAVEYLYARGLKDETISKFRLGFAPINSKETINYLNAKGHSNETLDRIGLVYHREGGYVDRYRGRIIFPLTNENDQVIGFSGRLFDREKSDNSPKYINSPETDVFHKTRVFYNLFNALPAIKKMNKVYILEGFMDVIALDRAGVNNALAIMGTAFSTDHVRILKGYNVEVILCLDGDEAGQINTRAAGALLEKNNINFKVMSPSSEYKDLDEMLSKTSPQVVRDYLNQSAIPYFDFLLNYYIKSGEMTQDKKDNFVKYCFSYLKDLNNPLKIDDVIIRLSSITNYSTPTLRSHFNAFKLGNLNSFTLSNDGSRRQKKHDPYGIVQIERLVLKYLLYYQYARDCFVESFGFLPDPNYDRISKYIIDGPNQSEVINPSLLITKFIENDDSETDELTNIVTDIELDELLLPVTLLRDLDDKSARIAIKKSFDEQRARLDRAAKKKRYDSLMAKATTDEERIQIKKENKNLK